MMDIPEIGKASKGKAGPETCTAWVVDQAVVVAWAVVDSLQGVKEIAESAFENQSVIVGRGNVGKAKRPQAQQTGGEGHSGTGNAIRRRTRRRCDIWGRHRGTGYCVGDIISTVIVSRVFPKYLIVHI